MKTLQVIYKKNKKITCIVVLYKYLKFCTVGPNNGKIIIKDLKDSLLYHELTNRIHGDDLEVEKSEDDGEYSSLDEIDKKKGNYLL